MSVHCAKRRLALAAVGFGLILLSGRFVPPWTGKLLVCDARDANCEYLLIAGSEQCYREAGLLWKSAPQPRGVLLPESSDRLVEAGILPSGQAVARRLLAKSGVPEDGHVIPLKADHKGGVAAALGTWLADRPEARVLVLADRFSSRRQRHVLDRVLDPERATRVAVRGVVDRRYDETDWWQSRRGIKEFGYGWLALIYAYCGPGPSCPHEPWDPDRYEQRLRRSLASSSP